MCNHRNHMTPNTGLSLTNHSRYGMILTLPPAYIGGLFGVEFEPFLDDLQRLQ